MLQLPTTGISRSVARHNVELDAFCDWIEGNILFDEEELSSTDVVDALCEDMIYDSQDMASEMVGNAWTELKRRQGCVGARCPFAVKGARVTRRSAWRAHPAHAFCVLLAYSKWHREWASDFGHDYTEQGELFELLTRQSVEAQFSGWLIHQTGWSRTNAVKLAAVVSQVTERLGETPGDVRRWGDPHANESGLDLLCYRPFTDNRIGIPVYLMQCASGINWKEKMKTPDLDLWTKIVDFGARPRRAFATPFAFVDSEFIRNCGKVDGMLLDRYRLLAAATHKENWLSTALKRRIIAWAKPRIAALPRRET
jgi:hypothetical protein